MNKHSMIFMVLCGLLIQLAIIAPQVAGAQELFTDTIWPAGRAISDATARPVFVELSLLHAIEPEDQIVLGFTPDRQWLGFVDRIEKRSPTQYSIFGGFEQDPDGLFIIVVENDVAVGRFEIPTAQQVYMLGYVADGVHKIEPIAGKRFSPCGNESTRAEGFDSSDDDNFPAPESEAAGDELPRDDCLAPPRHFDAIIFYTAAARIEAGGTNAMNAECQLAADVADTTYMFSGIPARMVLVFREEISYGETGDLSTDLDRLEDSSDGYMDNVHGRRNTFGGDFVTLFVSEANYDEACGLANCLPDESEAFCVVRRDCASSNFSFAHEIGHLQGCSHNREDAGSSCNYYCDSYGYRFAGLSGNWRTVMSYDIGGDPTYTRIGYFSNPNPNIIYDGVPVGISGDCDIQTNNAGTIYGTTSSRENWRNPRFEVWVAHGSGSHGTFQSPWSSVALGVSAVYGGAAGLFVPTLWIKEGTYYETMIIDKPMTIQGCGDAVRIGG